MSAVSRNSESVLAPAPFPRQQMAPAEAAPATPAKVQALEIAARKLVSAAPVPTTAAPAANLALVPAI